MIVTGQRVYYAPMGLIETTKEVVGLLQQIDNLELYRRMIELQQQAYALVDENRVLKERLATRDELTFRKNAYWRGEADGPFCSPCWDSKSTLIRLHVRQGYQPQCPSCKHSAADPDTPPPAPAIRAGRSGYIDRERF